jgi:hypothetical protein
VDTHPGRVGICAGAAQSLLVTAEREPCPWPRLGRPAQRRVRADGYGARWQTQTPATGGTGVRIIEDAALFTPPGESPSHWVERFRVPDLSAGTYSIPAGGTDEQTPITRMRSMWSPAAGDPDQPQRDGSGTGRFGHLCARR